MESSEILAAIFGSAVTTSVITSLFAKAQSDKSAKIDNIIKERKAWRDKLRELVAEVEMCTQRQDSKGIASVEARLVVLLNPVDKSDLEIIEALEKIPEAWKKECLWEFVDRISYLLKHDWERAKQETTTRTSPQTLALASFYVWLTIIVSSKLIPPDWSAIDIIVTLVETLAVWLGIVFFFVAIIQAIIRDPQGYKSLSWRKIFCWLTNEPFREEYCPRDKRPCRMIAPNESK